MSVGLTIALEEKGALTFLRLVGRVDATSSPGLEKKLNELMQKKKSPILVDFSKVDYLSSAGMRLLLSATKKMKTQGGRLSFFNINEEVMEIIKMAGFEKILSIFSSEEEALKKA